MIHGDTNMSVGLIYMHTNTLTHKAYIGQTVKSVSLRLRDHINEAKRKGSNDTYFHRALNKYPIDTWVSEVLHANVPVSKLDAVESYCIQAYGTYTNGYNMTLGGMSGRGQIVSEVTKAKLSRAGKGRVVTDETRVKISNSNKGKKNRLGQSNSLQHRQLISTSRVGIKNPGFKPWRITKPDGTIEEYRKVTKKQYAMDNNLPVKAFSTRFGKDKAGKPGKTGPFKDWIMENVND